MSAIFSPSSLYALAQVILIDVTLAGDNAIVVGMAVRNLPQQSRRIAILCGVLGAAVIRIGLALVAVRLLAIIGLTLAGGLLLMWVCWRMFREMRGGAEAETDTPAPGSLRNAIIRIIVADLSMSLDNVLAVAGAAGEHMGVLVSGLVISVVLMAVAASLIARLLERYKWISWVGLLVVLAVAIELIVKGGGEVWAHVGHGG
ncbi:YjbE family putative metal transport protein [Komagataeibacter sp. AV436]|uniref:YjbE family putative metal transport protein n=1 Tax=Komagataeibacter melomenusus TaxID=2766578 RepID=A0ABX2AF98_9PROT|nr:YjbE family putative metal transport protein [Komagataeibacter melomenusus]MBV1830037.1 YjbE family putative metal transport protein [Komagataeibacter melomenusus]NPC66747.1 YjbE family putative metal transport protein [Komagataeibacter melomenusus]